VVSDALPDLVKTLLELTHAAHSNMVLGRTASVLVLNGGVLTKDVAVAEAVNLVTGVALLVLGLVEPEGESALGILLPHAFGRKGNAKKRGEEATDIVGGVIATDMAHKGWTC
jgi:hypothetical protein